MPEIDEKNLAKLKKLLAVVDEDTLSRQEFTSAFQKVTELVLKVIEKQNEAITFLQTEHARIIAEHKNTYDQSHAELRGKVNDLFVGDQLKRMSKEQRDAYVSLKGEVKALVSKKLQDVDSRMSQVRDGVKGDRGEQGLSPSPALIREAVGDMLEALKKEVDEKVKGARRIVAGPTANAVQAVNLTPDSNTRSFQVPDHRVPLLLVSDQAPFFFVPDVHFVIRGSNLVINGDIPAPVTSQTLRYLYVK